MPFKGNPDTLFHCILLYLISVNLSLSTAFGPSLFQAGMSQMQSVLALNGFCAQQADMLRASNRSPTNLSDNSDQNPSSPELSMTMHPPLPGQVSFIRKTGTQ